MACAWRVGGACDHWSFVYTYLRAALREGRARGGSGLSRERGMREFEEGEQQAAVLQGGHTVYLAQPFPSGVFLCLLGI